MKKKGIAIAITVLVLLVAGYPLIAPPTNCGGNSAALAYTDQVAMHVTMAIEDRQTGTTEPFSALVPPSTWREVFRFGWGVQSYWVRKEVAPSETAPVVVCAQCFGNVPQPTIWNLYRKTPRFAAGFLRGRARLLDMSDYNSLDFKEYQYVTEDDVSNRTSPPDGVLLRSQASSAAHRR